MSFCKQEGKDRFTFLKKEDFMTPSKLKLSRPEEIEGIILPNGEINWNCPCLGDVISSPCGVEFRSAFQCFHDSKEDPKGAECSDSFSNLSTCMDKFPNIYQHGKKIAELTDEDEEKIKKSLSGSKELNVKD